MANLFRHLIGKTGIEVTYYDDGNAVAVPKTGDLVLTGNSKQERYDGHESYEAMQQARMPSVEAVLRAAAAERSRNARLERYAERERQQADKRALWEESQKQALFDNPPVPYTSPRAVATGMTIFVILLFLTLIPLIIR